MNKDFKEVIDLNDIPVINKDMQNEINNVITNYNIDNNTKIENSINIKHVYIQNGPYKSGVFVLMS